MASENVDEFSSKVHLHKEKQSNQPKEEGTLSPTRKYLMFIVCFIEILCFGGIGGGWNVFVYVLKQEGVYSEVCKGKQSEVNTSVNLGEQVFDFFSDYGSNVTAHDCDAQDQHFALAYTIATTASSLTCFPFGLLFDRYGLRINRLTGSICNVCMLLCLGFSTQSGLSWLVYPGACFMTVAGNPIMISGYHVCNILGDKASTGIGALTGASIASGSIMLLIKVAAESGFGFFYSLFVILGMQIVYIINSVFIMPRYRVPVITSEEPSLKDIEADTVEVTKVDVFIIEEKTKHPVEEEQENDSFVSQLKSPLCFIHILWFSISFLRINAYIGNFNAWVNSVVGGDKAKVSSFSDIYGYMLMGAIVLSPMVGILNDSMRRYVKKMNLKGTERTIASLPSLLLAMSACLMLSIFSMVQTEWAVMASIVCIMFGNAFVYPGNSTYVQMAFPGEHFGKMFGVGYLLAALMNFSQYGLFAWATETDNFVAPAIFLLVLVIISTGHAFNVYVHHRMAIRKRQETAIEPTLTMPDVVSPYLAARPSYTYDNEVTYL